MPGRTLIAALVTTLLLARASSAQWQPGGLPIAPGPGAQFHTGLASDDASGAFIAWVDGTTRHSRLLRIDETGYPSPGWPAEGIDIASVSTDVIAGLVSDGAGGVILFATAHSGEFPGVRAFRFDGSGAVPPPWPAEGREVPGATGSIRAISDALGGAFLIWAVHGQQCTPDHYCTEYAVVRAARVMADGTLSPFWPRQLDLDFCSYCGIYLSAVDAIADGSGGLVGLVGHIHSTISSVWSQLIRFDASGVGLVGRVLSNQDRLGGCLLPGGDFLVAAGDYYSVGTQSDIHVYRMTPLLADATGWPAAGATLSESDVADIFIRLIPDGGSGAFVVWTAYASTPSPFFRVQHATGDPPPATSLWPNPGAQIPFWDNAAFATDGIGGLVSTGYDPVTATLRAIRLDASGQVAAGMPPSGVTLASPSSSHYTVPAAIQAGTGGVIVVWSEQRAGDWNVYAQRLPLVDAVSTMVAGVSAEQVTDGVRVTWWLEDGLASALLVERSVENGAWQSLGSLVDVSSDHAVYQDHDVSSGHRYTYRLRAKDSVSMLAGSEVSVDYHPRLANVLVGFSPSPAVDSPRVRFQLAGPGMKELQIIDVAGRLVARHDVSGLAAGPHEVVAGHLVPGIYTLRLTGPSETRVTRGVVLR